MSSRTLDYYAILEIPSTSTSQQIRDAYKKAALKHHPDRVAADAPDRAKRTRRFQQINDAYYTLSDPGRRRTYDATRSFSGFSSAGAGAFPDDDADEEIPRPQGSSSSGFSFPWSYFFGGASSSSSNPPASDPSSSSARANDQFSSVFEEMLRDEGLASGPDSTPTAKFWSVVGGLSGAAMGFILANFPGAVAGGVAGNRLGAVRDKRGKSVYTVFQELPQGDRARLLGQLAARVFSHAVGSA